MLILNLHFSQDYYPNSKENGRIKREREKKQ